MFSNSNEKSNHRKSMSDGKNLFADSNMHMYKKVLENMQIDIQ